MKKIKKLDKFTKNNENSGKIKKIFEKFWEKLGTLITKILNWRKNLKS